MLLGPCYTNKRYYYYLPFKASQELMKKHPLGFQVNDVLRCLEGSGPFRNSCWVSLSTGLKPFSWIYLSESLKCLTSFQSQTKGSWKEMERNQINLICVVLFNAHTCVCIWVSMDIHVWLRLVGDKVETWSYSSAKRWLRIQMFCTALDETHSSGFCVQLMQPKCKRVFSIWI